MSLDWKIFCQLYQQTDDPSWGMYPHPSGTAIAKNLGVARGTVWRRLAALHQVGFLKSYEVIPNPALLGVSLRFYHIAIDDPRARLRVLEELEFVDGAFLVFSDFGPRTNLIAVSDFPSSRALRERAIARIEGVGSVKRGAPVWLPNCSYHVSPDGWRFIAALRRNPEWPLERLAEELGISTKTASRRYQTLTRERAILGHPVENFAKFPGVVAGTVLTLRNGADARSVVQAVHRLQPDVWDVPSAIRPPGVPTSKPAFLRLVRSASETEQGAMAFLGIPGVLEAKTFFPGTVRSYRQWFDARIFEMTERNRAR